MPGVSWLVSLPEVTTVNQKRAPGREARKDDKRARLREAAWDLFTTAGYDQTTTKAIAERAGVASGTLFLYARDKAELLFLVFHERLAAAVDEGLRTLPAGAPLLDQELGRVVAFRNCTTGYAFPLRSGFNVYGVLLFAHPEPDYFNTERSTGRSWSSWSLSPACPRPWATSSCRS